MNFFPLCFAVLASLFLQIYAYKDGAPQESCFNDFKDGHSIYNPGKYKREQNNGSFKMVLEPYASAYLITITSEVKVDTYASDGFWDYLLNGFINSLIKIKGFMIQIHGEADPTKSPQGRFEYEDLYYNGFKVMKCNNSLDTVTHSDTGPRTILNLVWYPVKVNYRKVYAEIVLVVNMTYSVHGRSNTISISDESLLGDSPIFLDEEPTLNETTIKTEATQNSSTDQPASSNQTGENSNQGSGTLATSNYSGYTTSSAKTSTLTSTSTTEKAITSTTTTITTTFSVTTTTTMTSTTTITTTTTESTTTPLRTTSKLPTTAITKPSEEMFEDTFFPVQRTTVTPKNGETRPKVNCAWIWMMVLSLVFKTMFN